MTWMILEASLKFQMRINNWADILTKVLWNLRWEPARRCDQISQLWRLWDNKWVLSEAAKLLEMLYNSKKLVQTQNSHWFSSSILVQISYHFK